MKSNITCRHRSSRPTSKVGEYAFLPSNAIETDREFIVSVYSDRTTSWDDVAERCKTVEPTKDFLRAVFGANQPNYSGAEQRFVIQSPIGIDLYRLITRKNAIQSLKGGEITQELAEEIDVAFERYFWAEVNGKLQRPLTRRLT